MKLLLLFEKFPSFGEVVRDLLEPLGYHCEVAKHEIEALEMVKSCHFNLLITDTPIPVLVGLNLYKQWFERENRTCPSVLFLNELLNRDARLPSPTVGAQPVKNEPLGSFTICSIVAAILAYASPETRPWRKKFLP